MDDPINCHLGQFNEEMRWNGWLHVVHLGPIMEGIQ